MRRNLDVNGKLNVNDVATMRRNLDVNGKLNVNNVATMRKNLNVNGKLNVNNVATMRRNLDVNGTLNVNGVSNFNNQSNFKKLVNMTNAELRIKNGRDGTTHFNYQNNGTNYIRGSTLSVDTSNTNFSKLPNFKKLVNMSHIQIRNLTKLSNDFINNKLVIPGELEVAGKLTVKNNLDVNGKLNVNNKATLKNNLDINGRLNVNGESNFNNQANFKKAVNIRNAELKIKNGKNGTTYFNYLNSGNNYIRGTNLNIDTSNNKLVLPDGLEIKGSLNVNKDVNILGNTTIGGKITTKKGGNFSGGNYYFTRVKGSNGQFSNVMSTNERNNYMRTGERNNYMRTGERNNYMKTRERNSYMKTRERNNYMRTRERNNYMRTGERNSYMRTRERNNYMRTRERNNYNRKDQTCIYAKSKSNRNKGAICIYDTGFSVYTGKKRKWYGTR